MELLIALARRSRIFAFLLLARAHFLVGGILLYALGVAVARAEGFPIDLGLALVGQIGVTAVQLMTHFSNEYFDYESDRAIRNPTPFSGGSRMLTEGLFPRELARRLSLGALTVSLAAVLYLFFVLGMGPLALAIYAIGIAVGWTYSAPPIRLVARGVGEMASATTVAFLVPAAAYALQTGRVDTPLVLAALPLVVLLLGMTLTVHLPDYRADLRSGKRNLVVRLGPDRAALAYGTILGGAYLIALAEVPLGLPLEVFLLLLLTLPLTALNLAAFRFGFHTRPERFLPLATGGIALFLAAAGLETAAFALLVA
ncbi:MAG: prenyltransferase [Anaerolineae bacterium]